MTVGYRSILSGLSGAGVFVFIILGFDSDRTVHYAPPEYAPPEYAPPEYSPPEYAPPEYAAQGSAVRVKVKDIGEKQQHGLGQLRRSSQILSRILSQDKSGLFSGLHEDLKLENSTATDGGPFNYLRGYDNPCWMSSFPTVNGEVKVYESILRPGSDWGYSTGQIPEFAEFISNMRRRVERGENWRLRCLPGVYLVGAEKCGTTDLIYQLTLNKSDIFPAAYKESRYWTPARLKGVPLSKYLDLYDRAADQIYNNSGKGLTVDATPYYLYNFRWRETPGNEGLEMPRYLLPHLLHKLHPRTRIIIMLRNPVERVYSLWRIHNDKAPLLEFHQTLNKSITLWEACSRTNSDRYCALHDLTEWMQVFGRNQVKVIKSEEYYADRVPVLNDIYSFLGLEKLPNKEEDSAHKGKVKNINASQKKRNLPYPTKKMIQDFFEPYNRKLSEVLNDDRFTWK